MNTVINFKRYAVFTLLSAVFLLLSGCAKENGTVTLKLAETFGETDLNTQADYLFAQLVSERTDGKVKIEVYPDSELGNEVEGLSRVITNDIAFVRVNAAALTDYSKTAMLFHIPFLFENSEHLFKCLDGELGEALSSELDKRGVKILSYMDEGSRQIFTAQKKVSTMDDLLGLRLRVNNNEMNMLYFKSIGANPVPLPYNEIYSAIETKAIDGADSNIIIIYNEHQYTKAKYVYMLDYKYIPNVLLANNSALDVLDDNQRRIVSECAAEMSEFQRTNRPDFEDDIISRLKEQECIFTYPSAEEKQKFIDAALLLYSSPVTDDFTDLINEIQALRS